MQDPADSPPQEKLVPVAILGPGIGAENAEGVTVVQVGGKLLDVDLRDLRSASCLDELLVIRDRSMKVRFLPVESKEIGEDQIKQLIGEGQARRLGKASAEDE